MEKNTDKVQKGNSQTNEKHTVGQSVKLSISNEGLEYYRNRIQQSGQEKYDDVVQRKELLASKKISDIDYSYEIQKKAAQQNQNVDTGKSALNITDKANNYVKAYAELYDEIVKGYENGTREIYVADENGPRKLTKDEELSNLDAAYKKTVDDFVTMETTNQHARGIIGEEMNKISKITTRSTLASAYIEEQKTRGKDEIPENLTEKMYGAITSFKEKYTMIQPNTMSDVNGEYMAADYTTRKVGSKETHYTTFSLWDTFRGAHPLYTLLEPERVTDFVKSMIRQYEYYGYLPIWQLWGQDNYCMIGNHSIPVIVDAIMKGIPGIDVEKAYEAVYNSSVTSHPNSPFEVWEKYGYMPENIQTQSVSITLEQAFDDWCVAQLAAKLNKDADYQRFYKRSEYYRNLFNPVTRFFQSKNDKGEWIEPFDPYKYGANGGYPFTEGNAWQYFWYVPHNVTGLIELTGGAKAFEQKLDTFFTTHHQSGELNDNASGFVGQYAHGNEPSHHVAYLYNYAGQPWKTQKYVSHIVNNLYNNTSSGYAGNDDCGEMSAWYVFSAMGFYPVNPADGRYIIGTPIFDECTLKLAGNKEFRIQTIRKSPEDIYIQSVTLNGKKYKDFFITHQDITNGGTIIFKMGKKPSDWGK